MRVFFGLELAPETAVQIADWRDRQLPLAGNTFTRRPVPPANFHITLAFVGELRETSLEQLCLGVDNWLAERSPTERSPTERSPTERSPTERSPTERSPTARGTISLDTIGYWPKPGIYWLGPDVWPEQLSELAQKLKGLATSVGGKRDRNRFQPHITLFRGCSGAPPPPAEPPGFTLTYRHFTLFESRQGRRGVSYHPLQDWPLD